MQVVPSQRLSLPLKAAPLSLYRALRNLNPSPYMYFLDLDGFEVIGSSPEILVRLEEGLVTVRPIADTRRRGATEQEDQAMEAELLADKKEIAEHLMLIDLGRNDVGRVSEAGSVSLTENMVIERYSHVMHIVSNVTARAHEGISAADTLRAALPAGTLSGAPKARAMEIIDELEPAKRGFYVWRRGGLFILVGEHGYRHRDPHCGCKGRRGYLAGGRGYRCGFGANVRVGRNPQQSASNDARHRDVLGVMKY